MTNFKHFLKFKILYWFIPSNILKFQLLTLQYKFLTSPTFMDRVRVVSELTSFMSRFSMRKLMYILRAIESRDDVELLATMYFTYYAYLPTEIKGLMSINNLKLIQPFWIKRRSRLTSANHELVDHSNADHLLTLIKYKNSVLDKKCLTTIRKSIFSNKLEKRNDLSTLKKTDLVLIAEAFDDFLQLKRNYLNSNIFEYELIQTEN